MKKHPPRSRGIQHVLFWALFLLLFHTWIPLYAQQPESVFFSDLRGIYKGDLVTGDTERVLRAGFLDQLGDMVLDPVTGYVYWTNIDFTTAAGAIYRADALGDVELLLEDVDAGLALDASARQLYWTRRGVVWSTDLDEGGSREVYGGLSGQGTIRDIESDGVNNLLYFLRSDNELGRLSLDEVEVEVMGGIGTSFVNDIELDLEMGKVFWVQGGRSQLFRANLDASEQEEVYRFSFPDINPFIAFNSTISFDASTRALFFANLGGASLGRFDVDSLEVIRFEVPQVLFTHFAHNGSQVFWTESVVFGWADDIMYRADYDGEVLDTLVVSYGDQATDLHVKPDGNTVYWMEEVSERPEETRGYIRRATVSPGGVEVVTLKKLVASSLSNALHIDFDRGQMYWSDTSWVHRADLDANNAVALVEADEEVSQIEIDFRNEKVYWTEGSSVRLHKANLDGSEAQDLVMLTDRSRFAIDTRVGRIRWIDLGGTLHSADLDGRNAAFIPGAVVSNSRLLAFDLASNKLYYRAGFSGALEGESRFRRMNVDATEDEPVPLTELAAPLSIAIPGEAIPTGADQETSLTNQVEYFPNPFTTTLRMNIQAAEQRQMQVVVVDLLGRHVAMLFEGWMPPGTYPIEWTPDAAVANGVYIIQIRNGKHLVDTKKVVKCC